MEVPMVRVPHRQWILSRLGLALVLWMGMLGGCYTAGEADLPVEIVLTMQATIVDLNPDAGSVMVKEEETYRTWRVAVVESTWVRARDGRHIDLAELRIGEKIEIRGTSRLENLITAYEINSLEDHPEEEDKDRPN
jgi:hypothetical protein